MSTTTGGRVSCRSLLYMALLAVLIYLFLPSPAWAFLKACPLAKEAAGHAFPLAHQADDKDLSAQSKLSIANCQINLRAGAYFPELVIQGQTKQGKKWTLTKLFDAQGGAEFFTGDLDRNGTEDLVVVAATGACGYLPAGDLFVILFDENHAPWPWEVHTYLSDRNSRIEDIEQDPADRKAAVYATTLIDVSKDPAHRRFFAQTSVYKASNCRFHLLPTYKTRKLPFVQSDDPPYAIPAKLTAQQSAIQNGDNSGALSESLPASAFEDDQDLPNGFVSRQFETFLFNPEANGETCLSDLYTGDAKKLLQEGGAAGKLLRAQKSAMKGLLPVYASF